MGPAGVWEGIITRGFRTAEQLIDMADLEPAARLALHTEPRRQTVQLVVNGDVVILRDQAPLFARADLASLLDDGLTVADWVSLLNRRIYFFTDHSALHKMLDKYLALQGAQDVLTISPMRLRDAAGSRLELAAQNSGAVARKSGPQKGIGTFVPYRRFPDRRPSEVTVVDGLDDLGAVAFAERHHANGARTVLKR